MIDVLVRGLRWEAEDIVSIELRAVGGGPLPAFQPGAHIDLHLPNGVVRSYSLCNSSEESHRYVVTVLKEKLGRGGSRSVHEDLRIGMRLRVSAPRNNFPLEEAAAHTLLIAGGIGITPMLCMARRLHQLGRSFELIYLAQSRAKAAFLEELLAMQVRMTLHLSDEENGRLAIGELLAKKSLSHDDHVYACGPAAMLDAFEKSCIDIGIEHFHVERFAAVEHKPDPDARDSFTVNLARSGTSMTVPSGQSILDIVLAQGIEAGYSCGEGICGACETRVLEGVPDHRDSVLSAKERKANDRMLICCSRSKSPSLTLDL